MGLFTPKYPKSDTAGATGVPQAQPRRPRRAAQSQPVDHSTIGESELGEYRRCGWTVERSGNYIVVERRTRNGGYEMQSFSVLGNGRYGKR